MVDCSQAQQQQSIEYTVKLTAAELDVVGEALGSQPYKLAAPLINKLRQQVIEQQQKAAAEPKKE
jgi:hypothetical protein